MRLLVEISSIYWIKKVRKWVKINTVKRSHMVGRKGLLNLYDSIPPCWTHTNQFCRLLYAYRLHTLRWRCAQLLLYRKLLYSLLNLSVLYCIQPHSAMLLVWCYFLLSFGTLSNRTKCFVFWSVDGKYDTTADYSKPMMTAVSSARRRRWIIRLDRYNYEIT